MIRPSEQTGVEIERQQPAEDALWATYQNSNATKDRERLFRHYQYLAKNMAARYKRSEAGAAMEYAELFQLASMGLLESIDRFKPELNIPFHYYANRRLSGAILNGIAKHSELNQQISMHKRMERERVSSLRLDIDKPRNMDEKLDLLGEIAAGLALGFMLEETVSDDGERVSQEQDAFETLAWKQAVKLVHAEMDQLQPQQRDIMAWHYNDGLQFDQIAAIMGLTKGRISQIHKAAVALLRKRLLHVGKIWLEG
jgi:RNA polymerase sigma factor FliA